MTRWEKILLWGAVAIIWLGTCLLGAGLLDTLVALTVGSHLGGAPASACDLPYFCMNGESSVPMSWVSSATIGWTVAYDAVVLLTLATALVLGTGVIRRISKAQAFARATLSRMGLVAGLLVAGGVIAYVLGEASSTRISEDSSAFQLATSGDGATIAAGPDTLGLALVFAGILALAFWAAFRQGARMQEELDYVV
ncbi:DUF2975 domain-containing protein [Trueperella bernardiae]|uniref:DUF2975 domain-containing protein n=1 Tax=Trueperella bernardiae TaxID=59561 RepID=UPI002043DD2B|nr:DUF2975 domain-containing protein [Trueperella bernardiae]MCM3907669.1 DUF2975 domain-containing protein [Trueperella bernardiae]